MKILKITMLVIAVLLVGLYGVSKYLSNSAEKSNVFSVSEIKNDDSTYKYVKDKCESGFFAANSQNCVNLKKARN